jgi:transposase-like protein
MANPVLSHPRFHDEAAAFEWVERIVWPQGPVCPHCGAASDHVGKLPNQRTKPSKKNPDGKLIIGLFKCYACREKFTVRVGTIFEDSHAPLNLWLQAMYMLCSSKKGFSTNQLARTLGVHMKTAWHMSHRIRLAMDESGSGPLGGPGKIVESDEAYTVYKDGGPTWVLHPTGWQKMRGPGDRVPVITLVERGGRARSRKVENVTAETLRNVVFGSADTKSRLMTDELRAYRRIGQRFAGHDAVNHGEEEWSRKLVDGTKAHVNTAEGFFSILKRGIYGCYFHVSEAHLHRYLAEYDFRYSNRAALGVDDEERTDRLIRGIVGKRLTYRETVDAKKAKAAK